MSYDKVSIDMDIFNLFGIPKNSKNLYFEKVDPFLAEYFTGYVSKPIWMTIMSKLENLEN